MLQRGGELADGIYHLLRTVANFHDHIAGLIGQHYAARGLLLTGLHAGNGALRKLMVLPYDVNDFYRRLTGASGQIAHFIGNHGKTPSLLTRPCGFDGRIERQQVGLLGNPADGLHNAARRLAARNCPSAVRCCRPSVPHPTPPDGD